MVTEYHKIIEDGLILLGNELRNQKRIKNVYRGNERPLSIVDPRSKNVLNYQPDAYFVLKNNKKLIFEVLYSEETKQDIIIADIIRSFLVENVDALILIYPGSESVEARIVAALTTIYKSLVYKGVPEAELPNLKKTGPYSIKEEEATSIQKARDKLIQYATEDKWWR